MTKIFNIYIYILELPNKYSHRIFVNFKILFSLSSENSPVLLKYVTKTIVIFLMDIIYGYFCSDIASVTSINISLLSTSL